MLERDLLRGQVIDEDLDIILGIPISLNTREDVLVWHYTPHEFYSVKTRYQLALELKQSSLQCGESSSDGGSI